MDRARRCRVALALLLALSPGCDRCGGGPEVRTAATPTAAGVAGEARPPPARASADAGGPAAAAEAGLAPEGPRELAWGRLIADLPEGFSHGRYDTGPPSDPREVAAQECVSLERGGRFALGLCVTPTLAAAADLERFARTYLAKQVPDAGPEVHAPVPASGARPALRVLQVRPVDPVGSIASRGTLPMAAIFFVAHPDGTVLTVEVHYGPDEPALRAEALALADRVLRSLAPGPVSLTRAAGRRTLRFGPGLGSVALDVPEGFVVVTDEGDDTWGFDIARPARVGAAGPSIGIWFHNTLSPDPSAYDDFPERRQVEVFGREVAFFSRREGGVEHLSFAEPVPELDATMFLDVQAEPGRVLEQMLAALGSAELRVNRAAIDRDDWDASQLRTTCGAFVVDPSSPLNVRAEPNAGAEVAATLDDGTQVEVAEQRGGWLRITAPAAGWAWAPSVRRQCVDR